MYKTVQSEVYSLSAQIRIQNWESWISSTVINHMHYAAAHMYLIGEVIKGKVNHRECL